MSDSEIEIITEKLKNHEKRILKLEEIIKSEPKPTETKNVSIKEFMLSKKPKGDVQKTLAIGYYLENYENMKIYNANDLNNGFRRAKEPAPKNTNNKVIKNIQKGHMMESKEKKDNLKSWCLTSSGERFVENGFKKE